MPSVIRTRITHMKRICTDFASKIIIRKNPVLIPARPVRRVSDQCHPCSLYLCRIGGVRMVSNLKIE